MCFFRSLVQYTVQHDICIRSCKLIMKIEHCRFVLTQAAQGHPILSSEPFANAQSHDRGGLRLIRGAVGIRFRERRGSILETYVLMGYY
jgi:hypothetical protein